MTLIQPLKPRVTLSRQVLDVVVNAIMSGEMAPGDQINEAELARRLGISRGPLREALSQLEGRQLLERVPGVGMRIIRLSQPDLVSLFEIRAALEGLACRRAAQFITEEELARLDQLLEVYGQQGGGTDAVDTYGTDDDFHVAIAYASRSDRLVKMLTEDLYLQVRLYRYQSERRTPSRTAAAWKEHREIVEALRARDGDRAAAAMEKHVGRAVAALQAPAPEKIQAAAGG